MRPSYDLGIIRWMFDDGILLRNELHLKLDVEVGGEVEWIRTEVVTPPGVSDPLQWHRFEVRGVSVSLPCGFPRLKLEFQTRKLESVEKLMFRNSGRRLLRVRRRQTWKRTVEPQKATVSRDGLPRAESEGAQTLESRKAPSV